MRRRGREVPGRDAQERTARVDDDDDDDDGRTEEAGYGLPGDWVFDVAIDLAEARSRPA